MLKQEGPHIRSTTRLLDRAAELDMVTQRRALGENEHEAEGLDGMVGNLLTTRRPEVGRNWVDLRESSSGSSRGPAAAGRSGNWRTANLAGRQVASLEGSAANEDDARDPS
jgi:hypothetical protein